MNDKIKNTSEKIIATYNAEVQWETKDLYGDILQLKNIFFKGIVNLPTGNIVIYVDDKNVFKNMSIRNFKVKEVTHIQSENIQGELFFVKNTEAESIAYRDDNNKLGLVYGKDVFEPGILTGFASHLYAKEKNIENPVFVHGSLVQITDTINGKKKNILLAGAHGSGKSYATFNSIVSIDQAKNQYPHCDISCKGDDWYILRKGEDHKIYGVTTDPSIALDKNILDNKDFSTILKQYEEKIVKAIMNNPELKKHFEEHFYDIEKWKNLPQGTGKIIDALKNILKDTSSNPKQGNLFHDINKLIKKISLPAEITSLLENKEDYQANGFDTKNENVIDSIIVLYPNKEAKEVVDISDMANIIAEGATNHYPTTKNELPALVVATQELLQILGEENIQVYNYKKGSNFGNIFGEILNKHIGS